MSLILQIKDMQEIALLRGGACLSKEYINESAPLTWRCEKGHTWDADYQIIRQGGWCPSCLKKRNDKIGMLEKMKAVAISKGGKCLSTEYIDLKHKLEWQCAEGHTWSVPGTNVFHYGTWCRKCAYKKNGEDQKGNIETMQKIATEHGGKCLSEKYINSGEKLEWQCSEGHRWMNTPAMVSAGQWCRICSSKKRGLELRDTIDTYQKIAEEHGGKLLSETYSGNRVPMLWQCSKGHQWKAGGFHIKNSKSWCPQCSGYAPLSLQDMIDEAAKNGGQCLSDKYINSSTKLQWKCAEGHTWWAKPNDIRSGRWCRICGIKRTSEKSKDTIEIFHEIAVKNGGKCLSTVYVNQNTKLEFECAEGHTWMALPVSIKNQESWCRKCAFKKLGRDRRNSIEMYQHIATKHGGKCLSAEYVSNKKKLEWECAEGHKWKATADSVAGGAWCNICAHKRIGEAMRDSIETYRAMAEKHGGKCLSTEYKGNKSKLEFQCAEGHIWKVVPTTIKLRGTWCPVCSRKNRMK